MFRQFLLSIISCLILESRLTLWHSEAPQLGNATVLPHKSIAVVGAGSAGLASLKTLLDLPVEALTSWEIIAFEQRRDVGGVWLPDLNEPRPPNLPETPLYPDLRINTPSPSMSYPQVPFREGTSLYPGHEYIWEYHRDFAERFNLTGYISFNTTVSSARWVGDSMNGRWSITVQHPGGTEENRFFNHLIVANGHNRYPRIPKWLGQEEWLASSPDLVNRREILHSVFWRNATRYEGRSVLVVGGRASGTDIIRHVAPLAKDVFLSLREDKPAPNRIPASYYTRKPEIARFTSSSIIFSDGSISESIDSVILGTGYEYRVPFLSAGAELIINASANEFPEHPNVLATNLRYIFPLHEHIFSLAETYPTNALAFVGLPELIGNCASDFAQSLLVAHAIADANLLPIRGEMIAGLKFKEERMRRNGLDPYYAGHWGLGFGDKDRDVESQDYQDRLVKFLTERGAVPDNGKPYVESWRRFLLSEGQILWEAWQHVERMGEGEVNAWLKNIKTEQDWANLMKRLVQWELDHRAL